MMSDKFEIPENAIEVQNNANSEYKVSKDNLKNKFKVLYENIGMKWTEDDEKEIEQLFESILLKAKIDAYLMSAELLYKVLASENLLNKINK